MFKVRAIVVAFLGNEELYPCHMGHKVGDEVIFDGESYSGRLCPDVWPLIATKVSALHQAGRAMWSGPPTIPSGIARPASRTRPRRSTTGLGYRCNLNTIIPPPHDMANLVPPDSFRLAAS